MSQHFVLSFFNVVSKTRQIKFMLSFFNVSLLLFILFPSSPLFFFYFSSFSYIYIYNPVLYRFFQIFPFHRPSLFLPPSFYLLHIISNAALNKETSEKASSSQMRKIIGVIFSHYPPPPPHPAPFLYSIYSHHLCQSPSVSPLFTRLYFISFYMCFPPSCCPVATNPLYSVY